MYQEMNLYLICHNEKPPLVRPQAPFIMAGPSKWISGWSKYQYYWSKPERFNENPNGGRESRGLKGHSWSMTPWQTTTMVRMTTEQSEGRTDRQASTLTYMCLDTHTHIHSDCPGARKQLMIRHCTQ